MKKLLAILLTAAMLATVLSVVSCGSFNPDELASKSEGLNEGNNDDPDNNGGTNADGSSESGLPFEKESAHAKLTELGQKDGYDITIKVTDTDGSESVLRMARKGNTAWAFTAPDSGMAFVQRDEQTVTSYSFSGEQWELNGNIIGQNMKGLVDAYAVGIVPYLYMAHLYENSLDRVGTDKVAGRDCIKYTYSAATIGAAVKWTACIDKELGLTLKWSMDVAEGGERTGADMEVISFKTGSAVTVPDLPAPGEDYADYNGTMGWPSNSFTALLEKAPGTVTLSSVQGGRFSCMTQDVAEADFIAYVAALQAKGFTGEATDTYFEGTDASGNTVRVEFTAGILAVTLDKAGE